MEAVRWIPAVQLRYLIVTQRLFPSPKTVHMFVLLYLASVDKIWQVRGAILTAQVFAINIVDEQTAVGTSLCKLATRSFDGALLLCLCRSNLCFC